MVLEARGMVTFGEEGESGVWEEAKEGGSFWGAGDVPPLALVDRVSP